MAVQQNPYEYWNDERSESDYRSRQTQASSLTRQMLRQPEYLRSRNRVNPGPKRNSRASAANSVFQLPHEPRNEDIWGWQRWTEKDYYLLESDVSSNLLEETEPDVLYSSVTKTDIPSTIIPSPELKVFEFTQSQPFDEWLIIHNLGFYPSVELFNSSRAEIDGDVVHISPFALKVKFNLPISGFARLN